MSSPEDDQRRDRSYRDGVGPADPPPVTDAMINPQTAPDDEGSGGPVCHVCGKHNRPSSTYCLQCGSALRGPDAPDEPPTGDLVGRAADEGWWDPDMDDKPWEREQSGPAAAPPDDRGREIYVTDETETVDEPTRDPQHRMRLAVWGILALAAIAIVFMTFVRGDDDSAAATSTTLATSLDAQLYGALISDLAADVENLRERATTINQRWDSDAADYQETLAALETLSSDMAGLSSRLRLEESPPGLSAENHTRLVSSAGTLEGAATGMVDGLKAADAGEERRAALARFTAAADEFGALADNLLQVIDLTAPSDTTADQSDS